MEQRGVDDGEATGGSAIGDSDDKEKLRLQAYLCRLVDGGWGLDGDDICGLMIQVMLRFTQASGWAN